MLTSSNRFAVFMEEVSVDSDEVEELLEWEGEGGKAEPDVVPREPPPPAPPLLLPKRFICQYSLTVGSESVQHGRSAPVQQVPSINTLNAISFFGRCFQCQYMSHSQKYCPLRQCKACKQYGHSETVCRRQKSAVRTFLDSVETANGLHGLLLTEVADADAASAMESEEAGVGGMEGVDGNGMDLRVE